MTKHNYVSKKYQRYNIVSNTKFSHLYGKVRPLWTNIKAQCNFPTLEFVTDTDKVL